jgi:Phage capsid family.
LARSIATGIDLAGLSGSGAAGNPEGIDNISGIATVDFASTLPTFAEVVELESTVAADNALMGSPVYLMNPSVYGELKTVEKATNTAEFIVDRDGMINGYPVIRSTQAVAQSKRMYFGNFADLLIGQFGPGVEIIVDPFSLASTGIVKITATVVMDVAVRHKESFVIAANNL